MTQLNYLPIIEFVKKYGGWVLSLILLLLLFQCEGQTEHSGAVAVRNEYNVKAQKQIDSLVVSNKKKDELIVSFEKRIAESNNTIRDINTKLASERIKGSKQIAKMKNYELADWQKYYKVVTGYGDSDIKVADNTLNMTKSPLVFIANRLVKYDLAKSEITAKNNIIFQKDTILIQKDKIIRIEKEKNITLLNVNEEYKTIKSNLENNVSDLQKDLKKANRVRIKPIIISAVLGGIVGAVIAK